MDSDDKNSTSCGRGKGEQPLRSWEKRKQPLRKHIRPGIYDAGVDLMRGRGDKIDCTQTCSMCV
eukprot:10341-Eustigmatos_ZCMA.PRE.1